MMFGGGQSRLLNQDTSKARSVKGTLRRLSSYFGRFWPMVLAAIRRIAACGSSPGWSSASTSVAVASRGSFCLRITSSRAISPP